jgi:hypothetical protein
MLNSRALAGQALVAAQVLLRQQRMWMVETGKGNGRVRGVIKNPCEPTDLPEHALGSGVKAEREKEMRAKDGHATPSNSTEKEGEGESETRDGIAQSDLAINTKNNTKATQPSALAYPWQRARTSPCNDVSHCCLSL